MVFLLLNYILRLRLISQLYTFLQPYNTPVYNNNVEGDNSI